MGKKKNLFGGDTIKSHVRDAILERSRKRCEACGFEQPKGVKWALLEFHRVKPGSCGGLYTTENTCYLCLICHGVADEFSQRPRSWDHRAITAIDLLRHVRKVLWNSADGNALQAAYLTQTEQVAIYKENMESAKSMERKAKKALGVVLKIVSAVCGRAETHRLMRSGFNMDEKDGQVSISFRLEREQFRPMTVFQGGPIKEGDSPERESLSQFDLSLP